MSLGSVVRDLRTERGMSIATLARRIGGMEADIREIEADVHRKLSYDDIARLQQAFSVTALVFIDEDGERYLNERASDLFINDPIFDADAQSDTTYAERLRSRRIELKLSVQRLAELSGVHVDTICEIESGKIAEPDDKLTHTLAGPLTVPSAWLGGLRPGPHP